MVKHQGKARARERRGNKKNEELDKKQREPVEGEEMWKCRVNDARQKVMTRRNSLWCEKAGRMQGKLYDRQVNDAA